MSRTTNVDDFIEETNAGIFKEKLGVILSDAAMAAVTNAGAHCKKSKVSVEFSLSQVGENDQVMVSAKIGSLIPTKRGKKSEEDTTSTTFFVGKGGVMTIHPPKEESGQYQLNAQKDGPKNVAAIK